MLSRPEHNQKHETAVFSAHNFILLSKNSENLSTSLGCSVQFHSSFTQKKTRCWDPVSRASVLHCCPRHCTKKLFSLIRDQCLFKHAFVIADSLQVTFYASRNCLLLFFFLGLLTQFSFCSFFNTSSNSFLLYPRARVRIWNFSM